MIIDFHTHVFSPEIRDNRDKYIQCDPLFSLLYSNPESRLATVDDLIDNMDKQGIDKSVILNIAWSTSGLCHASNDYLLESITRYPQRLYGFGMVKLDEPDLAVRELELLVKSGIKGIGEIRPSSGLLKNPLIKSTVQQIIENKLVLLMHTSEPVGHIYDGKGDITPQLIYPFIDSFPSLNLVCAHWGGGLPFYALMPEVKRAFAHVYFDSAASPYLYKPDIYEVVARISGPQKILFGSDYPLLLPGRLLKEIKSLGLAENLENQILAENALGLLESPARS
jgi:uncharacterized protein